jgi:hypothetical protein
MPDHPSHRAASFEGGNFEETPGKPQGKNFLFAIGIDEYLDPIPRLNNAVKDVHDFVALMQERFQFEKSHTRVLLNEEASQKNIYDSFSHLADTIRPKDNLLIYFSGHGEYNPSFKEGYWIPANAEQGAFHQYIPNSVVKTMLGAINSHHTFLIADSCFSGSLFVRSARSVGRLERDPSRWGLTSGRNEIVSDGAPGANSPFAESMLYNLRNASKPIPVQELCSRVLEAVTANAGQTPIGEPLKVEGHKGGQFVFYLKKDENRDWKEALEANTAAAFQRFLKNYPESSRKEEAHWRIAEIKNQIEAYLKFFRQFPEGKYAREAKKRISKLEDEEDWKEALDRDTISGYFEYLDKHPRGKYAAEANERIDRYQKETPSAPVYGKTLQPDPKPGKEKPPSPSFKPDSSKLKPSFQSSPPESTGKEKGDYSKAKIQVSSRDTLPHSLIIAGGLAALMFFLGLAMMAFVKDSTDSGWILWWGAYAILAFTLTRRQLPRYYRKLQDKYGEIPQGRRLYVTYRFALSTVGFLFFLQLLVNLVFLVSDIGYYRTDPQFQNMQEGELISIIAVGYFISYFLLVLLLLICILLVRKPAWREASR